MPSADPVLICFSYEYRNPAEDRIFRHITRRYSERGIEARNLFDQRVHDHYEGGFNLARWETLSRHIIENDLHDRKIIMQDITDVYVFDTHLDFDPDHVIFNRKLNCQYHALKKLAKDLLRPNPRSVNLSKRIDLDCSSLDGKGLWCILFDARYRTPYRLSADVVWGYGRSFVKLHEMVRKNIERVPPAIRFSRSDEDLYTFFMLHLPDVQLNRRFGERTCQNYNSISQEILGAASGKVFLHSKKIFTYQHSKRVPDFIRALSWEGHASRWNRVWSLVAYGLDQVLTFVLTGLTLVLQELKRLWIACIFVVRRLMGHPIVQPPPSSRLRR